MRIRNPLHRMLGTVIHGDLGPYTMYMAQDGGLVVFLSAPPKMPPSPDQTRTRNRFRVIGQAWRNLTAANRSQWNTAAKRARLRVHGAALHTWWCMHFDAEGLASILRTANVTIDGLP